MKNVSDKTLKTVGFGLTLLGLATSIGSNLISGKQQEREIEKAVNEAVDKKVSSELVDLVKKNLEENNG